MLHRKLPAEARHALRHSEEVAIKNKFAPLPPIRGRTLDRKTFCIFVVTDWSLFVLTTDKHSSIEGAVILELPLLAIRSMVRACLHAPRAVHMQAPRSGHMHAHRGEHVHARGGVQRHYYYSFRPVLGA